MRPHLRLLIAAPASATLLACGSAAPTTPAAAGDTLRVHPPTATIVLRNVNVVTMLTPNVIAGQTIVVTDGRIAAVGPASEVAAPQDALVIDGDGRYVMPGLTDMHAHIRGAELPLYLENGVTSVRNMWGYGNLAAFAARTRLSLGGADPDAPIAPAIYSASPGIDATPKWPETQILTDAAQADALVARLKDEGWQFIKAYAGLTAAGYDSVVASARRRGIGVIGHVPFSITLDHALASRQASIEHLSGYERVLTSGGIGATAWSRANTALMPALARRTADAGTWNCPTVVIFNTMSFRQQSANDATRARDNRRVAIRELHRAGARLLAGTDAGIDIVPPGSSLADELSEFVAAGLTPYEALLAATRHAAEFLDQGAEFGAVAVGMRADLLLLAGNPLVDIAAVREPRGVVLRGRWLARD